MRGDSSSIACSVECELGGQKHTEKDGINDNTHGVHLDKNNLKAYSQRYKIQMTHVPPNQLTFPTPVLSSIELPSNEPSNVTHLIDNLVVDDS